MSRARWSCGAALLVAASAALVPLAAQQRPEDSAPPGPGRETFVAHCSSCHSVDYIRMHAPFATRALWEAEVAKMRNAFKAPLDDADARAIVDYLVAAYGPGKPSGDDRK